MTQQKRGKHHDQQLEQQNHGKQHYTQQRNTHQQPAASVVRPPSEKHADATSESSEAATHPAHVQPVKPPLLSHQQRHALDG